MSAWPVICRGDFYDVVNANTYAELYPASNGVWSGGTVTYTPGEYGDWYQMVNMGGLSGIESDPVNGSFYVQKIEYGGDGASLPAGSLTVSNKAQGASGITLSWSIMAPDSTSTSTNLQLYPVASTSTSNPTGPRGGR